MIALFRELCGVQSNFLYQPQLLLVLIFILAFILYNGAVLINKTLGKKWPSSSSWSWNFGIICALTALCPPIANLSHHNFIIHMVSHLLLGMLAPLLMVLANPITLFLRTLPVNYSRRVILLIQNRFVLFVTYPIMASLLNIGGLWLLYTTNLYSAMGQNWFLHLFIHFHVFLAGYVFTLAMIGRIPGHKIESFRHRLVVFIVSLAGHGILSKYIYAHPPHGVSIVEAKIGGMLMYYGGDVVDIVLIFIFFNHWYIAVGRKRSGLEIRTS